MRASLTWRAQIMLADVSNNRPWAAYFALKAQFMAQFDVLVQISDDARQ